MSAGDGPLVVLGVVRAAHGLHGEVKLESFTVAPEDIAAYGPLIAAYGPPSGPESRCSVELLSLRRVGSALIARLDRVKDRSAAEALRGARLCAPRSRLPETGEDAWYHADLVGLAVTRDNGEEAGVVRAVGDHGAGAFLEIEARDGRTDLLPFSRAFVPRVDVAGGRIVIAPPEDFLEPPGRGKYPGKASASPSRTRRKIRKRETK